VCILQSYGVIRMSDFDLNDMIDFFSKDKKMKVIVMDDKEEEDEEA